MATVVLQNIFCSAVAFFLLAKCRKKNFLNQNTHNNRIFVESAHLKNKFFSRENLLSDIAILIYFALFKLLLHFLTNTNYGFHRDEFLYIDMGNHLSWGYLEVPPNIAVFAKISHFIFGNSVFGYRFFPALTGAVLVFVTGLIVRELGGRRFAVSVAALCVIFSPAFLRVNTLFQPVCFEQLYWTLGAYLLVIIIKRNDQRLWLAMGLLIGLGLLNKYSMLFFAFGVGIGLIASSHRKVLLAKWPWLAALIALLIVLPNLLWQASHGFPFFEHMKVLRETQLVNVRPIDFIIGQFLLNGLISTPIWLIGLYFFLFSKPGKAYRPIGWIYLSTMIVLLVLGGKTYYLLPTYPMLFAGGALFLERLIAARQWNWLKPVAIIISINLLTIPYGLPILPIKTAEKYFRYMAENLGIWGPLRWEDGKIHTIPQDYADMFGWENQVAEVAKVYHNLTPEEQLKCTIMGGNYGETGAINYYSAKYNLPHAVGVNGSYYLWGPGKISGGIMIAVGIPKEYLQSYFKDIELAAVVSHKVAREGEIRVYICQHPNTTLQELWPQLGRYRY